MAEESTYSVVTAALSSHRLRLILAPLTGAAGTGSISVADFLTSQVVADAINTWTDAHILPGTGITIDKTTDPNSLTIAASGGSGGYTDAAAIAAVGGALTPVATHLQKSVVGSVINLDLAQEVLDRLTALEQPSLIQTKDTVSASGTNYMNFPGGTGNYISTPSNAAYNSISDICIVVRYQKPATNPGTDATIVARYNSLPNAAQFRLLQVNTGGTPGGLRFVSTVDGTTQSIPSTTAQLPYDGQYIWIKVRRRASDGDTGFWTAPDTGSNSTIPTTWTALGSLNRASTAGALFNNSGTLSVPLSIGAYNVGALFPFTGQIARVLVYSGLDEVTGTVVADANAADYTSGTTWTGPLSRVWTISGTASVVLGGTTLISNTTSEFSLGETDAFPSVPVGVHYSLLWTTEATLINTSGSSVNFTPKLKIGGVDLFTWPAAIAIASAAGSVYNLRCAVKVSVNTSDGTGQIASAQLIINNAVTGSDLGSISMSSNLTNMSSNRAMSGVLTIATIPQMQLRMTMSAAAATVAARPLRTQLFLAAA
jgi:hypothetical protein